VGLRSQRRRRALVAGGSMAGLFAGLALRSKGWDVTIYERNDVALAGRGAGIVTHTALVRALEAVGADPKTDLGVHVACRREFAPDGKALRELPFPQVNTSWDRLFQLLRPLFPDADYRLGKEVIAASGDANVAALRFADGTEDEADLIVAADGIRSAIRQIVFPDVAPQFAGYVAWRGLVDESALSPAAKAGLFDCFSFGLPEGEQFIGYPVAGPHNDLRAGNRRLNFVWYRPADATKLARLLTDSSGKSHPLGIPPPLIRPEYITETRVAARHTLAPVLAEAVDKTSALFFQPIVDLSVPAMTARRVAIIGDAAFVARPHVGAGVTKAAEDALELAGCLESEASLPDALAAFDADRHPVGLRIIDQARRLGAYMQAQHATAEERQAAERHRSPDAVMRETASLEFLR